MSLQKIFKDQKDAVLLLWANKRQVRRCPAASGLPPRHCVGPRLASPAHEVPQASLCPTGRCAARAVRLVSALYASAPC